jgi:hypothetical protein
MKAIAKTVRYSQAEIREIREYADLTGEQEAVLLERASIRGLREERLERGMMVYLGGAGSAEAAHVAGMDRHTFLNAALERHLVVGDDDPGTLLRDLAEAAEALGDERLADAVARVARDKLSGGG